MSSHIHVNSQRNVYLAPHNLNETIHPPQVYPHHTQYGYNASFDNSPPAYSSALPATAAAATAYMSAYPDQTAQTYPHNPTYADFHRPGSPTSWRSWAGNMASNLEPGPEYINSASALMQLGGRGEGNAGQGIHAGVDMQQGNALNGATAQMWPFNVFNGGVAG